MSHIAQNRPVGVPMISLLFIQDMLQWLANCSIEDGPF